MSENQEEHASMDGFGADEEDADFQAALLLSMQSVSIRIAGGKRVP